MDPTKGKLSVGTKWSRMECIDIKLSKKELTDGDGAVFESWDEVQYTFLCECGKTVKMWQDAWPGKRAMKDCGCGLADEDLGSVMMAFTGPAQFKLNVRRYARTKGWSFSRAIVELVKAGLQADGTNWNESEVTNAKR